MLLGILPVLISTINKVYNNNNNRTWEAHVIRDKQKEGKLRDHEARQIECHGLISQFCANCCTVLTQQYSAYNR